MAAVHCGRPASGVIGEAKELHSARLPVVVVLALLVVTSIGQQGALRVPCHSEGGRVTLHLPQLLPCKHTVPPLGSAGFHYKTIFFRRLFFFFNRNLFLISDAVNRI